MIGDSERIWLGQCVSLRTSVLLNFWRLCKPYVHSETPPTSCTDRVPKLALSCKKISPLPVYVLYARLISSNAFIFLGIQLSWSSRWHPLVSGTKRLSINYIQLRRAYSIVWSTVVRGEFWLIGCLLWLCHPITVKHVPTEGKTKLASHVHTTSRIHWKLGRQY